MRRSLFALFRGNDGRSLTRALVALALLNAIAAGIHAAPAGAATPTLCSIAPQDAGGTNPANDDANRPCCQAGCVPAAMAAPEAPATVAPAQGASLAGRAATDEAAPAGFRRIIPPARGPPVLC